MGTRSMTYIRDENGTELATIYRQFDGYPTGMGADLKAITPHDLTNGFTSDQAKMKSPPANGMGCLAATVVDGLKDGIGNVYLYPAGSKDCGQEFNYVIYPKGREVHLKCSTANWKTGEDRQVLYDGPIAGFEPETAEAA